MGNSINYSQTSYHASVHHKLWKYVQGTSKSKCCIIGYFCSYTSIGTKWRWHYIRGLAVYQLALMLPHGGFRTLHSRDHWQLIFKHDCLDVNKPRLLAFFELDFSSEKWLDLYQTVLWATLNDKTVVWWRQQYSKPSLFSVLCIVILLICGRITVSTLLLSVVGLCLFTAAFSQVHDIMHVRPHLPISHYLRCCAVQNERHPYFPQFLSVSAFW